MKKVLAILILAALTACGKSKVPGSLDLVSLAHDLTMALQSNDVAAVKSYQDATTAAMITPEIVAHAAKQLSPLGSIKSVNDVTPGGAPVHIFDVTFDHGVVREKIKVDPDFKIVQFAYHLEP